jgi:hypothetical protein
MCSVSAVLDYGMQKPPNFWTKDKVAGFKKVVDEAERFDEEQGEPECETDYKIQWLKDLEERVRKLEAGE